MCSQGIEWKIGKRQIIVTWIVGILAISGVILLGSRFYLSGNEGMRGAIIMTRAGREFDIKLGSNATTGYQWQLAEPLDEKMINLIRAEYIAPNTNLTGAPGMENWTFIALKPGKSKVALKCIRPWEKDDIPADRKEFIIIIR